MNRFISFFRSGIICCAIAVNAGGQTSLELILKTSEPVDSAFLVHWTNKESLWLPFRDTLRAEFKTTGRDFYHINYTGNGNVYNAQIFLDTGNIRIVSKIVTGKLVIDSVYGSPYYNETKKWQETLTRLRNSKDTAKIDSFLLDSYSQFAGDLFSFRIGSTYVNMHQNNPSRLYPLLALVAAQDEFVKKKFGFSQFHDRLQGLINNQRIDLSDFLFMNTRNKKVRAEKPGQKYTILDFWFVGCGPCMADHLRIPSLLQDMKQKDVSFISISRDESYSKWKKYLKKHKYNWPQYKIINQEKNLVDQLGITTYPTYIILNGDGRILYTTYSLDEILKHAGIRQDH